MKTFDIYEHPHFGRVVVKRGFNWPAAGLLWIWAWAKDMTGLGFALFGAFTGSVVVLGGFLALLDIPATGSFAAYVVLMPIVGPNASKWRSKYLRKMGYKLVGTIDQGTVTVEIRPREHPGK